MAATKAEKKENTVAKLDKQTATLDKITDDGKKHKQGDVISRKAFGVVIKTKF